MIFTNRFHYLLTVFALLTFINSVAFAHRYQAQAPRYHAYYKDRPIYKDTPLFKDPCPTSSCSESLMDGFYIGAQGGYDSYWVSENFNIPAPTQTSGNPKINATGWVGGLLVGYGQYLSERFYLGGEVFGNYNQANQGYTVTDTGTSGSYSANIQANSNYGVSLLPGIKVNEIVLAYLRAGYNWVNLHSNESSANGSPSKSNTSRGPSYGLGLEALIADNWSARGEYTHTNYNAFTSDLGTRFAPSDNQVMAAVLYHFAS